MSHLRSARPRSSRSRSPQRQPLPPFVTTTNLNTTSTLLTFELELTQGSTVLLQRHFGAMTDMEPIQIRIKSHQIHNRGKNLAVFSGVIHANILSMLANNDTKSSDFNNLPPVLSAQPTPTPPTPPSIPNLLQSLSALSQSLPPSLNNWSYPFLPTGTDIQATNQANPLLDSRQAPQPITSQPITSPDPSSFLYTSSFSPSHPPPPPPHPTQQPDFRTNMFLKPNDDDEYDYDKHSNRHNTTAVNKKGKGSSSNRLFEELRSQNVNMNEFFICKTNESCVDYKCAFVHGKDRDTEQMKYYESNNKSLENNRMICAYDALGKKCMHGKKCTFRHLTIDTTHPLTESQKAAFQKMIDVLERKKTK
jgi:hypothetical protein